MKKTNNKFYKLPQDLARRRDINGTDKVMLAVIVDRMGRNGVSWPGVRQIAKDAGVSVPTVLESIRRLEKVSLLTREKRKNGQSNLYRITEKSAQETLAVKNIKRSRKFNSGVKDSLPEALKKLELNQTDQLNQTKEEEFMSLWNSQTTLPKIQTFTRQRKQKFQARMKEPVFRDHRLAIVRKLAASPFHTGQNDRGWQADVDWILKNDTNYMKIFERPDVDNAGIMSTHEVTEAEGDELLRGMA